MTTIIDVLEQHRIDVAGEDHHHVGQGWIGVDCPQCSRLAQISYGV